MKRRTPNAERRTHSFTLIELLAVVSIISLLIGLLVPTIGYARKQANKARARTEMDSLRVALRAYYHEYGYWPAPGNSWVNLSTMLNGDIHPYTGVPAASGSWAADNNPRAIRFMEFKQDSVSSAGAFLDPWGVNYCVMMDHGSNAVGRTGWTDVAREDNQVPNPGGGQIQAQIAAYSFGPDKTDNNGADSADDVKTWTN